MKKLIPTLFNRFSRKADRTDLARSSLNVLLATAQPIVAVASELTQLTPQSMPETERARSVEGPVTPATEAFFIWAPIFLSSLGYAVYTATSARRSDPVLRKVGWLTSTAYASNILWSLNSQLRGLGWSSVVFITSGATSATAALLVAERAEKQSEQARVAALAIAPLAGWLTLASFANLEATLNQVNGRIEEHPEARRAIALIAGATGVAASTSYASGGNPLFAAAVGWGLSGIVLKNIRTQNMPVAIASGVALGALAAVTLLARRTHSHI